MDTVSRSFGEFDGLHFNPIEQHNTKQVLSFCPIFWMQNKFYSDLRTDGRYGKLKGVGAGIPWGNQPGCLNNNHGRHVRP
jgi:hypothetical protein